MGNPSRGRGAQVGLAGFVLLGMACLVWPGFPLAAKAFPARVLGLPFALVWSVGWILATLVVVTAYHFVSGGEEQA